MIIDNKEQYFGIMRTNGSNNPLVIDSSGNCSGSTSKTNFSRIVSTDLLSKTSQPNSTMTTKDNTLCFTKNKKKVSNSKLNRLSLRRSKSSQSGQIGSASLSPSIKTEGNVNQPFSPSIGSGVTNPFLQNLNAKPNQAQDYLYPTLKRNTSTSSTSISDHPQECSYPTLQRHNSTIVMSSIPKSSSCLGLKKCISVSTLEESLESTNRPRNSSLKKGGKKVSFTNLQIREYELKLGDHPSCKSGPPITIGWNYSQKEDVPLDAVVDDNACGSKIRRKVDANTRCEWIRSAGYTKSEILQSTRSQRRKVQRSQSDVTLMRGVGCATPMALQKLENCQNYAYPNHSSTMHNIHENQLHHPSSTKVLTTNHPLVAAESNALSLKSNEVLNEISDKFKLQVQQAAMMHQPQHATESSILGSRSRALKRAESDLTLIRSAGSSSRIADTEVLTPVQEHQKFQNFAYPNNTSALQCVKNNTMQQPNTTKAVSINQRLVVAESNALFIKTSDVLDSFSNKLELLSKNRDNKIQQPTTMREPRYTAESNLLSVKSDEVINDMGKKLMMLANKDIDA